MKPVTVLALSCALAALPAAALDLQGHRGARGLAPENTLAGFKRALAIGVTTLELDVFVTRDGQVVIHHDPTLSPDLTRDPAGAWLPDRGPKLVDLDLAELKRYDIGRLKPDTEYAKQFAEQQPADGERIPTLAALFEQVKALGGSAVRFNVEAKLSPNTPEATPDPAAFARSVLAVMKSHGIVARSTLQSFDWRVLLEAKKLDAAVQTSCLTVQRPRLNNITDARWTAGLNVAEHGGSVPRLVKAAGCSTWAPNFNDLTADHLREARSLGLLTKVWTVNQPADIERMLVLGVDGIITDYPDRVRAAMAARGLPLPAPLPAVQ